jgi:hypothetical protein
MASSGKRNTVRGRATTPTKTGVTEIGFSDNDGMQHGRVQQLSKAH